MGYDACACREAVPLERIRARAVAPKSCDDTMAAEDHAGRCRRTVRAVTDAASELPTEGSRVIRPDLTGAIASTFDVTTHPARLGAIVLAGAEGGRWGRRADRRCGRRGRWARWRRAGLLVLLLRPDPVGVVTRPMLRLGDSRSGQEVRSNQTDAAQRGSQRHPTRSCRGEPL